MNMCCVPGVVIPMSSDTNLWHLRGALYGADNFLLKHIPVAFQLLCSMILLIQHEKGCSVNGRDWGQFCVEDTIIF